MWENDNTDSPSRGDSLESTSITTQEVEAELEQVLHSAPFERSERLQRFLRFICEETLKGEAAKINEYLIGSEVFHRGPAYSPNEDSIVRRQAHTLRQKLQEYYSAEGRDHCVRIELPIGRYVPVFRRQHEEAPPRQPQPAPATLSRPRLTWLAAAGAVALFAAGWFLGRSTSRSVAALSSPAASPIIREIWGPWFDNPGAAIICFSNPMTAVIKHFDKPLPPDAKPKRLPAQPEEERMFRQMFHLPPGGYLYFSAAVSQSKTGEAIAAVHLTNLMARAGKPVDITQSRFLSWEDLRRDNLILLGHNEANQWIDPLLKQYPFRLAATSGERQRGIVNTAPRPGEQPFYQIAYSESNTEADQEYALVSMIRGVESGHQLLLINGLNTQATQIATEYLTSQKGLQQLVERLRKERSDPKGPWRFQVVLRTEVYDKVPTKASLVAVRVLD